MNYIFKKILEIYVNTNSRRKIMYPTALLDKKPQRVYDLLILFCHETYENIVIKLLQFYR